MDADDLLHRFGEHAERVVLPQVFLGGEREFDDVVQGSEIIRVHAHRVEAGSIVRNPFIGPVEHVAQAVKLERTQRIDAGGFDRFDGGHGFPPVGFYITLAACSCCISASVKPSRP